MNKVLMSTIACLTLSASFFSCYGGKFPTCCGTDSVATRSSARPVQSSTVQQAASLPDDSTVQRTAVEAVEQQTQAAHLAQEEDRVKVAHQLALTEDGVRAGVQEEEERGRIALTLPKLAQEENAHRIAVQVDQARSLEEMKGTLSDVTFSINHRDDASTGDEKREGQTIVQAPEVQQEEAVRDVLGQEIVRFVEEKANDFDHILRTTRKSRVSIDLEQKHWIQDPDQHVADALAKASPTVQEVTLQNLMCLDRLMCFHRDYSRDDEFLKFIRKLTENPNLTRIHFQAIPTEAQAKSLCSMEGDLPFTILFSQRLGRNYLTRASMLRKRFGDKVQFSVPPYEERELGVVYKRESIPSWLGNNWWKNPF